LTNLFIVQAIKSSSNSEAYYQGKTAADICASLDINGYSDWFYNFEDGTQDTAHVGRDMAEYGVRAIRAFSDDGSAAALY
jgi:hypothetical protein